MDPRRWKRLGALAARQWDVLGYRQLLECGFSEGAIQTLVESGALVRLHRGVFALAHRPLDRRGHLIGALLACGPTSCTSHLPAAEHFGILSGRAIPQLEVTVPRHGGPRSRSGIRVHRSALGEDERVVSERVACTSPSRTLLDIAAVHPQRLEGAIKRSGDRGILEVKTILTLLDRYHRRPGGPLLRRLLDIESPIPEFTRSGLERRMYRLCEARSIQHPMMNVPIEAEGGPFEVDCVWLRHRLIVECDSRHHDNPITSLADARRDQALTLAGWRMIRMRWAQIIGDPDRAARTILHLLREQEKLLRFTA